MKVNILITLFFTIITSFKLPISSIKINEKNGKITLFIYPNNLDTSTYIKRELENKKYCTETIIYKNEKVLQTFIGFNNDTTISYNEVSYSKNNVVEFREYLMTDYKTKNKSLFIQDSLAFEINYSKYGEILNCGYNNSGCMASNEFYFNKNYTTYETGFNSGIRTYDTITEYTNGEQSFRVLMRCGEPIGIWRKFDLKNNLIDSTKY